MYQNRLSILYGVIVNDFEPPWKPNSFCYLSSEKRHLGNQIRHGEDATHFTYSFLRLATSFSVTINMGYDVEAAKYYYISVTRNIVFKKKVYKFYITFLVTLFKITKYRC